MSPSIILKAGALALACASTAVATYTLKDNFSGVGFFDNFDFVTEDDPTLGYVDYQSQSAAVNNGLIMYDKTTKSSYMGVDFTNVVASSARGRQSVRIESKETYQYGLFVIDLAHMPSSTCGLWPAFWTASHVDYPSQGEIDILENIHKNTVSVQTLHTYPGCNVTGNAVVNQMTGSQVSYNCDDASQVSDYGTKTQYLNQGCTSTSGDPKSYGSTFNAAGGGVYVMEWTKDTISIWNWEAGSVPSDVTSGAPVPSGWGKPVFTTAHSTCNIDSYFKDHHLILNTDFCGTWAGQTDIWKQSGCYDANLYPSCTSYVKANPSAYKDAYWSINSLKVYKDTKAPVSSSSVSSASTTSTASAPSLTSSVSASTLSTVRYGNASTIIGGGGSGSDGAMTTSTVFATSVYTITSCAPTVTNCPVGSVTTETIALYTTVCPVSAVVPMTTSTVYATSTYTVTSCAATITNCPARLGSVTTETIALYTTVCPVSGSAVATSVPYPTKSYYTSTVVMTLTYTITSCAPSVTSCPANIGKVTTEVVTSTKVLQYTPGVAPSGTGAVVKTSAGGVTGPSASPITGAANGLKVGSVGALVVVGVLALLI